VFSPKEIALLIEETKVTFPSEREVKVKLFANKRFNAIRNIALMNATNTNHIPDSYRDFYLDKGTKKLITWAHHFESRHNRNKNKSME